MIGLGGRASALWPRCRTEGVAGALINQPSDFIALASGFSSLGLSTDYVDNFQYTITGVAPRLGEKTEP